MDNETSTQELERKEKPLNELLTSSMVNIYVGQENTHWYLHERLLCYYSPFFSEIFYTDDKSPEKQKAQRNKAYGLEQEDDLSFEMFVGWLYSRTITVPKDEKDIGPLLDLYLLSEKLQSDKLSNELVDAISDFYYHSQTYPSLRRVQHIYANTDDDNQMREMMVGAVAKLLTTSAQIPAHWASALQRNGQLAVDIIRSIQQWKIEDRSIPDARDRSSSRGRSAKNGFSAIAREGTESLETEKTGPASDLGVKSINSDNEQDLPLRESGNLKSEDSEAPITSPPPTYSSVNTPSTTTTTPTSTATSSQSPPPPRIFSPPLKATASKLSPSNTPPMNDSPHRPKKPPDATPASPPSAMSSPTRPRRRLSVQFAERISYTYTFFPSPLTSRPTSPAPDSFRYDPFRPSLKDQERALRRLDGLGLSHLGPFAKVFTKPPVVKRAKSDDLVVRAATKGVKAVSPERLEIQKFLRGLEFVGGRSETLLLGVLWMLYLSWITGLPA